MRTDDIHIPAQLAIVAWADPVIDALGFPPNHAYSEVCALPAMGPSAVLAWRRLAGSLYQRPEGFTLDVADFARALGLGAGTGRNAPMCRTLRRLVAFDLARFIDADTYAVRRRIPPVSSSQLRRLSPELTRIHGVLLARHDAQRLADRRVDPVRKEA